MRHLRWLVPLGWVWCPGWRRRIWFATHGAEWVHQMTRDYCAQGPVQMWANEHRWLGDWPPFIADKEVVMAPTVWLRHRIADLEAQLKRIPDLFPDDAPHKHPDTGVSLLDDVRDLVRDLRRAEKRIAGLGYLVVSSFAVLMEFLMERGPKRRGRG